ncbi:type IV pilin protein [Oxalobacteraceae bacterium OM1]|nr:type IV pilin protein [Oxalobacteraceae bacterium OM1]
MHRVSRRHSGFTLIELVIAVVIVGILAAVALPSYRSYVIRGNRAAAQAQMMDIANREQQYFLANRAYADKTTVESNGYALPSGLSNAYSYDVTLGSGTVPTFTITFTAIGAQSSDGNLTLDNNGTKTPASKW